MLTSNGQVLGFLVPGESVIPVNRYREMVENTPGAVFMYGEPYIPKGGVTIELKLSASFDLRAFKARWSRLLDELVKDPANLLRPEVSRC